ncbi:Zinc finger protein [Zostera marina]|uniref:Zinc finger protein n=1 Tax=Zostera marina TaxID=29655 RepID=A0A0K9PNW7_ZOSMR|nr:Zinc finger protein [Zostera marina]
MARGKQKIEAQKKNAEKNQKSKGSQIEARAAALKTVCSICKAQLANQNQLVDHYGARHPKENPPSVSSSSSN